jgi:hypothetical protein
LATQVEMDGNPAAHSAIQAVIVRAQQTADERGKPIGLAYDLSGDQIAIVDISGGRPEGLELFRTVVPVAGSEAANPSVVG